LRIARQSNELYAVKCDGSLRQTDSAVFYPWRLQWLAGGALGRAELQNNSVSATN